MFRDLVSGFFGFVCLIGTIRMLDAVGTFAKRLPEGHPDKNATILILRLAWIGLAVMCTIVFAIG